KRLDAVSVASEPELTLLRVPQGKRKHAAQLPQARFTPLGKNVDQDFGIAVGDEGSPLSLQLRAQFTIVIDFTIKRDYPAAARVRHRLGSPRSGIDNREPAVAENDALVGRCP